MTDFAKEYKRLHKTDRFKGNSILKWIPFILKEFHETGCNTLMDYGCGKAEHWYYNKYSFWGETYSEDKLYLYDPYYKPLSNYVPKEYDCVTCIDVLEHIPEKEISRTLSTLFAHANKLVFLVISDKPSNARFADGTNCHVTIKPKEWWWRKIDSLNIYGVKVRLFMSDELKQCKI